MTPRPGAGSWLRARAVILGTGGAHGLFSQQVSTAEMTGDGQAACWRAGAELVNMEFHQFGPALVHPYVQLFSKACFVLHPRMLNAQGHEFLQDYLPAGITAAEVYDEKVFPFTISNASRWIDIAIAREIAAGRGTERGTVRFSFAHVPAEKIERTMPNTARWMRERGVDPQRELLDVGIAFQCLNGGVRMVDDGARTSLPGVHVIGELAGGVRGPDRPGGNSLAEGQVFGHRAGVAAAQDARQAGAAGPIAADAVVQRLARALRPNKAVSTAHLAATLREIDAARRAGREERSRACPRARLRARGRVDARRGRQRGRGDPARSADAGEHGDHRPHHPARVPRAPRVAQRALPHRPPRARRRALRHRLGHAARGRRDRHAADRLCAD